MFKRRLVHFYMQHNPACLDSVDDILDIFRGREEELFRVLEEKYADVGPALSSADSYVPPPPERTLDFLAVRSNAGSHSAAGLPTTLPGVGFAPQQYNPTTALAYASPPQAVQLRTEEAPTDRSKREGTAVHSLRDEDGSLRGIVESIQRQLVVAQAEVDSLRRQRQWDEETMQRLREHIALHDRAELDLVERLSALELSSQCNLDKEAFASIIAASQERLVSYYESKLAFMQCEMTDFYRHAAERIREKDSIIAALKKAFPV